MTNDDELTGGCACGAVRYTLKPGFRMKPYACHCTICQKRTGSAFSEHMRVMKVDLELTGETDEGRFSHPSGMRSRIIGCAQCRSRIYATSDLNPDAVSLRWGTLDTANEMRPEVHIWVKSKQPWIVIPDDVPALETQPEDDQGWTKLLMPEPSDESDAKQYD